MLALGRPREPPNPSGVAQRGWRAIMIAGLTLLAAPSVASAQIKLFPELLPEPPPAAEPTFPTAPAEDAPEGFRVEGLNAPGLDAIGLEGGLGATLFQGAELALVRPLIAALPVDVRVPQLRDLTVGVLIAGAALDGAGGALLEARIERLSALGELEAAAALLDQLPPMTRDSGLARLAVDVALLTADDDRACTLGAAIGQSGQSGFWDELTVFCRLQAGDEAGARLAVDLLREVGGDPLTLAVAEVAVSGDPARPLPALREPTPLQMALLRVAGHPLPEEALVDPEPRLVAADVRAPELVPDLPLELAERALLLGALSADDLRQRYAEAEPGGRLDAPGEAGALARAGAWQRFEGTSDPATRARVADEAWRGASGETRFVVADVFGPALLDLPEDERTLAGAPGIARMLLARGQFLPATRWLALLRAGAPGEAAGIAPLFALAGIGGAGPAPVPDRQTIEAWAATRTDPEDELTFLLALLEGTGAELDNTLWWSLLQPPLVREARAPVPAVFLAAEEARAERQTGEAILASLVLLDGDPTLTSGPALIEALQTLRAVGLDADARTVAVQSALLAGL